jgi:hypothetical protein
MKVFLRFVFACLRVLCVCLCVLRGVSFSLDRNAFTFTNYDLQVHVDPPKSQLKVTGTLTLRNDSPDPQRFVDLQISSSLEWTSVLYNGKPVQYMTQPYMTDIDHTGAVSEAIVTLPAAIPPRGTLQLQVAYEGAVNQDSTRLTRIGVPASTAADSDWDRISESFTALRGVGYVLWYPVALESASLSDGNAYFDALGEWRLRHAESSMQVAFWSPTPHMLVADGTRLKAALVPASRDLAIGAYDWPRFGLGVPSFAIADYQASADGPNRIYSLPGHGALASQYLAAARALATRLEYARDPHLTVIDLPDAGMAPFESGDVLFAPLQPLSGDQLQLLLARSMFRGGFSSPRPWVEEGLAHFAQADVLNGTSRQAALAYMKLQLPAIIEAEKPILAAPQGKIQPGTVANPGQNLLIAADEALYGSKAMYVWWMLRDLVGVNAFAKALDAYNPQLDRDPTYVQSLFEKASGKKLEWFFDDWVYRDRGLPDFRPGEIYARPVLAGSYVVTVVVQNKGGAGAEVPVIVHGEGGEITQRVLVPAHDQGTLRVSLPSKPLRVTINDGSVPEWDLENNTGKAPSSSKVPPQ